MYRRTSLPSPEYSPRSVCSWTAAIGALAELGGGSALVGGATAASLGYSAYSSAKSSSQISASMKQANAAQQAFAGALTPPNIDQARQNQDRSDSRRLADL